MPNWKSQKSLLLEYYPFIHYYSSTLKLFNHYGNSKCQPNSLNYNIFSIAIIEQSLRVVTATHVIPSNEKNLWKMDMRKIFPSNGQSRTSLNQSHVYNPKQQGSRICRRTKDRKKGFPAQNFIFLCIFLTDVAEHFLK